MTVMAYGAYAADTPLESMQIMRRAPDPHDVAIAIVYCGICHSDLHTVRGEWEGTLFPCVPGHEIVGRVTAVGSNVTTFEVGDLVGVGCMVDSCQSCPSCAEGLEQYCEAGMVPTYNGPSADAPGHTLGGYAQAITVNENFVLKIRHGEEHLAAVAPLLCAGITTWSPLRHWNIGPGMKVGIVGIGGLGHMGVKLAHALGVEVVAFTTSADKCDAALALGADQVVVSRNADEMAAQADSFDFILNTVAASHDLDAYTALLKRDGTMTLVGVPEHAHPTPAVFNLVSRRRSIAGSMIGGIAETQEMLDFCADQGITADIELIRADEIEAAFERMRKGDVKYRFVLDTASLA
ncbi:zinc-binding dehydrogenase [Thioclava sp. SK-1]|uniref:NAD(P)-dependent alcohol dehydrogenase n=1 Tax=Thioclava sp. SK-1 TaxID=1889770 RepID=UPI0008264E8B|nr:NAD(P)-dependent alcohol dehydrogenase [Thioclava sp. SK-1]OCX66872.1 zinc-binding dehydrogenase [Thioclava sp. SK-1]